MSDDQQSSGTTSLIDENKELPPQVVPKLVYVSKEGVLRQALEKLSLKINECRTCAVGNGEIIGSICIDAPPHGQYSLLHNRKIFGDYKSTKEDALESAILAALVYLQKMGLIFVDDINQSEVRKYEAKLTDCQSKLLAASNWANMFQEQTEQLQSELAVAHKDNENLIQQIKAFGPKKDEPTAETTDTEKNMHALQVIHVKKETSTPPPSDHDTINQ